MPKRTVVALVVAPACTGTLLAEETRGGITKIEDGSITIRTLVVANGIGKFEEKTFKIGNDIKIVRVMGMGKEDVNLTLDELKMAVKDTKRVSVRIMHNGENGSVIKVYPPGLGD
jgi:hypothetical protein